MGSGLWVDYFSQGPVRALIHDRSEIYFEGFTHYVLCLKRGIEITLHQICNPLDFSNEIINGSNLPSFCYTFLYIPIYFGVMKVYLWYGGYIYI